MKCHDTLFAMKKQIAMLWRLPGLGAFPRRFHLRPVPLALKRPKSSMAIPHKAIGVHQELGFPISTEPKMPTMEDCVGETPLVRLQRMVPAHSKSLVLCKLEGGPCRCFADFLCPNVQLVVCCVCVCLFDLFGCVLACSSTMVA